MDKEMMQRDLRRMAVPVVAVLLWGISANAAADTHPEYPWEAGVHLSLARTSEEGRSSGPNRAIATPIHGFSAGGFAHIELAHPRGVGIGVQTEILYTPRGSDIHLDGTYLGRSELSYLEMSILARVRAPSLGPAAFHVVAGPVPALLLTAKTHSARDGSTLDRKDDRNPFDLGLAAGIGAVVAVTPRISVEFETRYVHGLISTPNFGDSEVFNRTLFFTLGVGAHFGAREALFGGSGGEGEGDRDGDGVPDERDACVEPEDRDGFMDEDGCPDPDNDVDGVPDARDACPDRAEDEDDVGRADGCPASDRDGDGVPDGGSRAGGGPGGFDQCPDQAETRNGYQDDDGCPEPDRDGDGVVDPRDVCPARAGTGAPNGCPYPGLTISGERVEPAGPIELTRAGFSPASRRLLDELGRLLTDHPAHRLRIVVWARGRPGQARAGRRQARRRADAIAAYLGRRGVAAGRVAAEAEWDESAPAAGASRPRAIEFEVELALTR